MVSSLLEKWSISYPRAEIFVVIGGDSQEICVFLCFAASFLSKTVAGFQKSFMINKKIDSVSILFFEHAFSWCVTFPWLNNFSRGFCFWSKEKRPRRSLRLARFYLPPLPPGDGWFRNPAGSKITWGCIKSP